MKNQPQPDASSRQSGDHLEKPETSEAPTVPTVPAQTDDDATVMAHLGPSSTASDLDAPTIDADLNSSQQDPAATIPADLQAQTVATVVAGQGDLGVNDATVLADLSPASPATAATSPPQGDDTIDIPGPTESASYAATVATQLAPMNGNAAQDADVTMAALDPQQALETRDRS